MNKEELKFLMSRGFTVSELLEIEGGGTPQQPEPAPQPADPDPAPADPAPADPDPAPADPAPDPSAAKIAALEAQIERLQAQVLAQATSQPDGSQKSIEDLVAAF